ncbi:hypothetical protein ACEQPO_30205 [Bacillus sp. SL00103]
MVSGSLCKKVKYAVWITLLDKGDIYFLLYQVASLMKAEAHRSLLI